MHIGIPKETKDHEYRVALTPEGARRLVEAGHDVSFETGAGAAVGYADTASRAAGARLVNAAEAWSAALVVKVNEPQPAEIAHLRDGQLLFCYLHLAAAPLCAHALLLVLIVHGQAAAFDHVDEAFQLLLIQTAIPVGNIWNDL